jgi:hypothetical protein
MDKEIWKDVIGFEEGYQVSNLGSIRSKTRKVYNYIKPGRVLKTRDNGNGYQYLSLSSNNKKSKHVYVHRLVAEAFIPNINRYKQVNHKDFNKSNNSVDNLEWVSVVENLNHYRKSRKFNMDLKNKSTKAASKTLQRVIDNKDNILILWDSGFKISEIKARLNCGRDFISDVLKIFDRLA